MVRPTVRLIALLALAGVALFFALAIDSAALMGFAIAVPVLMAVSLALTISTWMLIPRRQLPSGKGAKAKQMAASWLIPRTVRIEYQWSQLDQHDRVIRRIRSAGGPPDRGLYRLDATAVTWFDAFGLWKIRRLIRERNDRDELRNPPDLSLADAAGTTPMVSRTGRSEETDSATVRRYESGDPWRMIAWRASAHRGTLMTREGSRDARSDTLIVIDTATRHNLDACLATALNRCVRLHAAGVHVAVTDGETVYSNADAIERFLTAAQPGDHDVTVEERARTVAETLNRLPGYVAVLMTPESDADIPTVVHTAVETSGDSQNLNESGNTASTTTASADENESARTLLAQSLRAVLPERRLRVERMTDERAAHADAHGDTRGDTREKAKASGAWIAQALAMPALLAIAVWQSSALFESGWWTWFAYAALLIVGLESAIPAKHRRTVVLRGAIVGMLAALAGVVLAVLRVRQYDLQSAAQAASASASESLPATEKTGLTHILHALKSGATEIYEQYVPAVVGGYADALLIVAVAAIAIVLRLLLAARPLCTVCAVLPIVITAVAYAWAGQELALPWIAICLALGGILLWATHDHRTRMRPPAPIIASVLVAAIAVGFTPMAVTAAQRVDISLGDGGGVFSNGTINPIIDLKRGVNQTGATTVFTYTAGKRLYFRLATLDDFNGDTWSFSQRLSDRGGFYSGQTGGQTSSEAGSNSYSTYSTNGGSGSFGGGFQYSSYSPYNRFGYDTPLDQYLDILGGTETGGLDGADWEVNAKVTIDTLNSRFLPVPSGSVDTNQVTSSGVWRRGGDSAFYSTSEATTPGMTYTATGTYISPIQSAKDFSTIDALNALKDKASEERTSQTLRIRIVDDDSQIVTDTDGNRIGRFTQAGLKLDDSVIDKYDLRGRSWLIGIPDIVSDEQESTDGMTAYRIRGYTIELNPSGWLIRLMSGMYGALGAGMENPDGEFAFLVPPLQTLLNDDGTVDDGSSVTQDTENGDITARNGTTGGNSNATGIIDEQIPNGYDELPSALPSQVTAIVDQAKRQGVPINGSGAESQIASMEYLVDYFTNNGFTYSLNAPDGSGRNNMQVIGDFLDRKTGYCAHYASALAVFGRAMGVKTRMVLGYAPGSGTSTDGSYAVASNQLHSWVEAYINGLGWIPFDVTPASGDDSGAATTGGQSSATQNAGNSASAQPSASSSSSASASQGPSDTPSASASSSATSDVKNDSRNDGDANDTAGGRQGILSVLSELSWSRFRDSRAVRALAVLALLALAYVIVTAGMWLRALRRRRRLQRIREAGPGMWLTAWREVTDTAWDWSVRWPSSSTEQDVANAITRWMGESATLTPESAGTGTSAGPAALSSYKTTSAVDAVALIARRAESAAYGNTESRDMRSSADTDPERLIAMLDDVRAAMARSWVEHARSLPPMVRVVRSASTRLIPRSLFRR
ncbi:transglutaminaseTgpA domain-containing protein [Bifidobacterium vansinderenii]|nr:transglutaminaseTgpA domain-containing protein [Bifidobacterium vansinderenii]